MSPYIVAITIGWIVAQGAKYVIAVTTKGTLKSFRHLYLSGGMPSAHSATVVALVTVIALKDGVQSGLFALALLFAAIVMYDAVMVRRSSGEQGLAIQALIKERGSAVRLPRAARGHEPLEVLIGALLGGVIGVVVFVTTR